MFSKFHFSATVQNSLDGTIFSYIFIYEVPLSCVRDSITFVHIQKSYKMYKILFHSDSF